MITTLQCEEEQSYLPACGSTKSELALQDIHGPEQPRPHTVKLFPYVIIKQIRVSIINMKDIGGRGDLEHVPCGVQSVCHLADEEGESLGQ